MRKTKWNLHKFAVNEMGLRISKNGENLQNCVGPNLSRTMLKPAVCKTFAVRNAGNMGGTVVACEEKSCCSACNIVRDQAWEEQFGNIVLARLCWIKEGTVLLWRPSEDYCFHNLRRNETVLATSLLAFCVVVGRTWPRLAFSAVVGCTVCFVAGWQYCYVVVAFPLQNSNHLAPRNNLSMLLRSIY